MILAAGVLSLAGCVTHDRDVVRQEPTTVVQKRTTVVHDVSPPVVREERQVVVTDDIHHAWWNSYHAGEIYDPALALPAHRLFCENHPGDRTCIGWDWR